VTVFDYDPCSYEGDGLRSYAGATTSSLNSRVNIENDSVTTVEQKLSEVHHSMGHPQPRRMISTLRLANLDPAPSAVIQASQKSDTFPANKGQIKEPAATSSRARRFNDEISADLMPLGNRHVMFILDDYSSLLATKVLPSKDPEGLLQFVRKWTTAYGRAGIFRTDGGGENVKAVKWLETQGCEHSKTPPGTPSSNGRQERCHRTIMESLRAVLAASGLPKTTAVIDRLLDYTVHADNNTAGGGDQCTPNLQAGVTASTWDLSIWPGRHVYFKSPMEPPKGKVSERWQHGRIIAPEWLSNTIAIMGADDTKIWRVHRGRIKFNINPKPLGGYCHHQQLNMMTTTFRYLISQNSLHPEEPEVAPAPPPPPPPPPPPVGDIAQNVKNAPRVRQQLSPFQSGMFFDQDPRHCHIVTTRHHCFVFSQPTLVSTSSTR